MGMLGVLLIGMLGVLLVGMLGVLLSCECQVAEEDDGALNRTMGWWCTASSHILTLAPLATSPATLTFDICWR